ncbi:hypothetical protein HY489_01715 [Candidatus Woesearchaeota archaeon]|nr:hypothetical protein [Candidatus Woesearchaeota archaeon]
MNLRVVILRKLFRRRVIGGKHTAFENVTSGIPSHLSGDAKTTADELIKERLILSKPTSYGLQISLNPERLDEIIKIIESDEN